MQYKWLIPLQLKYYQLQFDIIDSRYNAVAFITISEEI